MRGPVLVHGVVLAVTLAVACTADFSVFDTSGKSHVGSKPDAEAPAGPDATAGGSDSGGRAGSPDSGGAAGAGGKASGRGGTSGVAGAMASAGDSDAGGPDAGASGADGGTPGSGGSAGGAAGAGGVAGSGACTSTEKLCAAGCVSLDAPLTGCGAAACDPCALKNVGVVTCMTGVCSVGTCVSGFGDCNLTPSDGCERTVQNDVLNCGACDRACSSVSTESRACAGNQCTSVCPVGRANCARPASGADDGCETDASADPANCGGCSNRCAMLGVLGCKTSLCGCTADEQCRQGSVQASLTCDTATGLCHCDTTVCAHGETCSKPGTCVCNGARACAAGRTCCQTPAGCIDLMTTATSCGACGRACPPGFVCSAGACQCNGNDDCNAGSAGTCTGGACVCGTIPCPKGQRCLGNGQCG